MAEDQTEHFKVDSRSVMTFAWLLRSANHLKFTEDCVMCTEKLVLVKKMFTDGEKMNLPLKARAENHTMH